MGSDSQVSLQGDVIADLQRFQDTLIAKRLPGWLKKIRPEDFALLREALTTSLVCRQQLGAILARIEPIDAFAKRLLSRALSERHDLDADVDQLFLRQWYAYESPTVSYSTSRLPTLERDWYETHVVWAALQNFSQEQVAATSLSRQDALVDNTGQPLAKPSAAKFVRLCRDLDLGKQYQAHLSTLLQVGVATPSGTLHFSQLLENQQRANMLVDGLKAWAEGVLNDAELQLVVSLYRNGEAGRLAGKPVVAKQLLAFECELQQVVVFDVVDEGWLRNTSHRVLVYIPEDPQGPWSVAQDLEAFCRRILGWRLRDRQYRKFFARFVRRRDAHRFFAKVEEVLGDVADFATRELGQHMKPLAAPLFRQLALQRIRQIKEDAAMIATPVANIDLVQRKAHDQRLEAEGWSLLMLASLFVPQLGLILLAAMAWDLLQETFHLVDDWHDGDSSAALDHLVNVGETLVVAAAAGAAGVAGRAVWQRALVVDGMVPALLEDGSEKLWNQDLAPYVSASPAAEAVPDAMGIYRSGDETWIEMDGYHYSVYQQGDEWYLDQYARHSPLLEHNEAGAWRLWSEQPAQWRGAHRMFRRLGGAFARLPGRLIDHVLSVHGLDELHLRALHVFSQVPEVELTDTVNRFLIADRVADLEQRLAAGQPVVDQVLLRLAQTLPGATGLDEGALARVVSQQRRRLFEALYGPTQIGDEATHVLMRQFRSLHLLAAEQLMASVGQAQRQQLVETGRVPLELALAARDKVVRIRVARAGEGLWIDTPQTLDFARAVLKLLGGLSGAPAGKRWQLVDVGGEWARYGASDRPGSITLCHQEGMFWLRDAQGADTGAPGELFETLVDGFDFAERQAMALKEPFAQHLRQALAAQWVTQRQEIAEMFGADRPTAPFLLPRRLDDGRLGYPLSGGRRLFGFGAPRALTTRLRYLYPAMTEEQAQAWVSRLAASPGEAENLLDALEAEFRLLRSTLTRWQRLGALRLEWLARYGLRKTLIDRWRYSIPGKLHLNIDPPEVLWDIGLGLNRLPDLPEPISFPHIRELALRDTELQAMPEGFLRAFPNLTSLELTNCKLRKFELPAALLPKLTSLDFSGNAIKLDAAQVALLERCESLVYLNLSSNPLVCNFSVAGMVQLRTLLLRSTRLGELPGGVVQHPKLSRLEMTGIPSDVIVPAFWESSVWRQGRVRLGTEGEGAQHWHDLEEWQNPVPNRFQWQDIVDTENRDDFAALWQCLEEVAGSRDFFDLLARLATAEDFSFDSGALDLAYRVYDMMETIKGDDELCASVFAASEIRDCGDSAIVRFSDLELFIASWRLNRGADHSLLQSQLLEMGGRQWRLEQLDDYARNLAYRSGMSHLAVDVVLLYRTELADTLQLPLRGTQMRFRGALALTVQREAVLNFIQLRQTVPIIAKWFTEQDFWRQYLARTFPARLRIPATKLAEREALREADDVAGMAEFLEWERSWMQEQRLALTKSCMAEAALVWNIHIPEGGAG